MAGISADQALGIDIGGTGIKGGLVDLTKGELIGERFRLDTPQPATPDAVAETVGKVAQSFSFDGACGVDFPGVVLNGVVQTAANMDKAWIGTSLADTVGPKLAGPGFYLNDADAAGLAEARYGAGRGHRGLVVTVTFGTGIGIALIHDGKLVPNAELGHIEIDGHDAEHKAAASARERDGLSWEHWAKRASKYLVTLENLIWPELIILGGGISKKPDKWVPLLKTRTPLAVAQLINNAGIVGSALAANEAALDRRVTPAGPSPH
ncbi:ROK family protein [Nakamurella flavida]|uniref:ROK family protein n=1 Tax=Nakamurella flavida TaxID=363630 RepID=A0A938YMJ7_9ACTN|nr:ROK family protein [Nakamurella flavida]MBM9477453.1 ROK family protein [Nakamurella flavida]MDP9777386.1 polyphosphate glucokinase [Nakamurella flavida]